MSDSRETYETWEACLAEGVRERRVSSELPPTIQELHDKSLTDGRDILAQADSEDQRKWLAKDGQDWSGAFTHDPKAYMDSTGRKRAEPGAQKPVHDPHVPGSDDDEIENNGYSDDSSDDDSDDLGIQDATSGNNVSGDNYANGGSKNGISKEDANKANKKSEKRKHRGLLQWNPVRVSCLLRIL